MDLRRQVKAWLGLDKLDKRLFDVEKQQIEYRDYSEDVEKSFRHIESKIVDLDLRMTASENRESLKPAVRKTPIYPDFEASQVAALQAFKESE